MPTSATAESAPGYGVQDGNGDPRLFISVPGARPPDHRGDGAPVLVCYLYDEALLGVVGSIKDAPPVTDPVEGQRYLLTCLLGDEVVRTAAIVYDPALFVVDPATLAQYAERALPLLYPAPSTAPPNDTPQLVGVSTWLWIDEQDFREVDASISIANLSVTARAHPTRVIWVMGDGSDAIDCGGPGTPYRPDVPDVEQRTDCKHAFSRAGEFAAQVYIEWQVDWSASNGDAGVLGPTRRGVTVPMTVESRQAVITG
ncbi:MAG: hypothetical protein ACR2LQ_12365 [Acidimicrobiales bacterium]